MITSSMEIFEGFLKLWHTDDHWAFLLGVIMMDDQDCIGKSRGRGRGREEGWKDTSHTMTYHDKKKFTKYSTAGTQMLDESPLKINAQFSILNSFEFWVETVNLLLSGTVHVPVRINQVASCFTFNLVRGFL